MEVHRAMLNRDVSLKVADNSRYSWMDQYLNEKVPYHTLEALLGYVPSIKCVVTSHRGGFKIMSKTWRARSNRNHNAHLVIVVHFEIVRNALFFAVAKR